MRRLDTVRLRVRSMVSGVRRRLPASLDTLGGPPRPELLDLRLAPLRGLDPDPDPSADPTVLGLAAARAAIVDAVAQWGPISVRVWTGTGAAAGCWTTARSLIRFAHRLDCPTTLLTDGVGLDEDGALDLVGGGLAEAKVLVTSQAELDAACTALRLLTSAADARGVPLRLTGWLLASPAFPEELDAAGGALARAGAHAHHLIAGWRDDGLHPALVSALRSSGVPQLPPDLARRLAGSASDGQPGLAGSDRCPVAHHRAALGPDGRFRACPHKAPLAPATLEQAWLRGAEHFTAIRQCDRHCLSPLLIGPH